MDNCPDCGKLIDQETKAIYCSICKSWLHKIRSNVTDEQYAEVTSSPEPFYCNICISESLPPNLVSLTPWEPVYGIFALGFRPKKQQFSVALPTP